MLKVLLIFYKWVYNRESIWLKHYSSFHKFVIHAVNSICSVKIKTIIMKKGTKIIATISDKKCDVEFLTELFEEGMNVVRLNTAHQSHSCPESD